MLFSTTEGTNDTMDYDELVGEPGFENDVKVEADELILYGCHLCQDLAFEDYDDLEEHLQKHIENGDVIDVKQVDINMKELKSPNFYILMNANKCHRRWSTPPLIKFNFLS